MKKTINIYLCRHGETEWTVSGQHTSFTDIPLTKNGSKQAVALGKMLKHICFNKVFVSPMIRSTETFDLAKINRKFPDVQYLKTLEPLLMEWNYGEYEGFTTAEIRKTDPAWNLFQDGAPGGETPAQVAQRADTLLKHLKNETGNIAIFSHAHFSRVLAARWLGLNVSAGKYFYLSVASISVLGLERDEHVIKLWNQTDF